MLQISNLTASWRKLLISLSSAQCDGAESVISDMEKLRSLCQKVPDPETSGGVQAEQDCEGTQPFGPVRVVRVSFTIPGVWLWLTLIRPRCGEPSYTLSLQWSVPAHYLTFRGSERFSLGFYKLSTLCVFVVNNYVFSGSPGQFGFLGQLLCSSGLV